MQKKQYFLLHANFNLKKNCLGENCEFCESGTYGDAVSSSGCTPCHCNGHEDRNKVTKSKNCSIQPDKV